jgi:uncharacterized protein (DUF2235 family)
MALYAFDGTGNEDREGADFDSNVLDFFRAYDDPLANDDPKQPRGSLYLKGIGQRARTPIGDKFAEAFGIGGHRRVRQALDRLEDNFDAGDTTIDVVGFSRGAALAISFANEIAKKMPGLAIRFIGVWDIVGQFGLPGRHVNAGHDLDFPPNVEHCYHAMALDERRALFPLTRLSGKGANEAGRLTEVWFRGVHSDVGGGNGNRGLNWVALNWMFENAVRHGLPIRPEAIFANLTDRNLPQQISDHKVEVGPAREIRPTDLLHASVQLVPGIPGRPHNNPAFTLARIDDGGTITTATA